MKDPKCASVQAALGKRGYVPIQVQDRPNMWYANVGDNVVSWIDQDGNALCLHVRRRSEQADPQSDYFPGSFAGSIRQAMEWATEVSR